MRRPLSFALGALTLAVLWLGPLPALARHAFSAHMTLHMGVVAVAAPLLALGVAGGRWDPVPRARRLFLPVPAAMLELVAVWAWHAPGLHHFAKHAPGGMVVEQGTFLVSGLLIWLSALGGGGLRGGDRTAAGLAALLLTFLHMTLLGVLLAAAPRALFAHGVGVAGLSPLVDQHLGGAIMLVAGASYLAGGVWLARVLLRRRGFTEAEPP